MKYITFLLGYVVGFVIIFLLAYLLFSKPFSVYDQQYFDNEISRAKDEALAFDGFPVKRSRYSCEYNLAGKLDYLKYCSNQPSGKPLNNCSDENERLAKFINYECIFKEREYDKDEEALKDLEKELAQFKEKYREMEHEWMLVISQKRR